MSSSAQLINRTPEHPIPEIERAITAPTRGQSVLMELPFWLGLAFWALLPSIRTPWYEIASIPVDSKNLSVVILAGLYAYGLFAYLVVKRRKYPEHRRSNALRTSNSWHHGILTFALATVYYATMTLLLGHLASRDRTAMLFTLIWTLAAIVLGYALIVERSATSVRQFLQRLTLFLAAVGLLYSAESLLDLGLRSDLGKLYSGRDFGIQRVAGPLFGASTGYFILIPALSFSLQELLNSRKGWIYNLGAVFCLLLTIIAMGSRAGLLILSLLFVGVILLIRDRKRVVALALLTVLAVIAGAVVFSSAQPDRLTSVEGESRFSNHRISLQIVANEDLGAQIFGSGYGAIWPWYLQEADYTASRYFNWKDTSRGVETRFGRMTYHPHSVFLLLFVELGLVGLLVFTLLWIAFARLLLRNASHSAVSILTAGVVVSGLTLFFDLVIVRRPPLNAIWWTYLFGTLMLTNEHDSERNFDSRSPVEEAVKP